MSRLTSLVVGLCVMTLSGSAVAQDGPGTISRSFTDVVKVGHEAQYEEAVKEHHAWHRQQGDTWRWNASVIVSGERLGQYIFISGGHHWADFDSPVVSEEEDAADGLARHSPHVESTGSGFSATLLDLSRLPADPEPAPLVQVFTYRLNPGQAPAFQHVLGRFVEAAEQTNWPGRYIWIASISGGADGTYILVVPHENWASLAPRFKTPPEVLEEAFGRQEADSLNAMFNEAVDSVVSEIWEYRPDLSYIP